jgi:hypothetical protein
MFACTAFPQSSVVPRVSNARYANPKNEVLSRVSLNNSSASAEAFQRANLRPVIFNIVASSSESLETVLCPWQLLRR